MKISEVCELAKEEFNAHELKGCPFDGAVPTVHVDFSMGSYRPEMHCSKCRAHKHGGCTYASEYPAALAAVANIQENIRALIRDWNQRME